MKEKNARLGDCTLCHIENGGRCGISRVDAHSFYPSSPSSHAEKPLVRPYKSLLGEAFFATACIE